jgi:DNA phosphorothioation-dependent restriction protein DptH
LPGFKKDSPYSLMHKFVLARFFEPDATKTIGFAEFFNSSTVLSLGGIASNDRNLKMVMIIFMNLYRDYMLGVQKFEFLQSGDTQLRCIDSYLLIDEANLIMEFELPVLEDLLLKGREFGIGIILSSQYLSHFRKSGTNYLEPLLTWFIHKVPNVTVKELQSLGLINSDSSTVEKVKSLDCHYCYYKGLEAPGVVIKGHPHYLLVDDKSS